MVNSVDPDQTAPPQEQSDLGLLCLPRPECPNICNFYGMFKMVLVLGRLKTINFPFVPNEKLMFFRCPYI